MRTSKSTVVLAGAAVAALVVSGCGGGNGGGGSAEKAPAYNAGITGVVNPSDHEGGTVAYQLSSTPDSMDPGNTYYAFMWDFSRIYARALTTFQLKTRKRWSEARAGPRGGARHAQ